MLNPRFLDRQQFLPITFQIPLDITNTLMPHLPLTTICEYQNVTWHIEVSPGLFSIIRDGIGLSETSCRNHIRYIERQGRAKVLTVQANRGTFRFLPFEVLAKKFPDCECWDYARTSYLTPLRDVIQASIAAYSLCTPEIRRSITALNRWLIPKIRKECKRLEVKYELLRKIKPTKKETTKQIRALTDKEVEKVIQEDPVWQAIFEDVRTWKPCGDRHRKEIEIKLKRKLNELK